MSHNILRKPNMQIKLAQFGQTGLAIHALMETAMLFVPGLGTSLDSRQPASHRLPPVRPPMRPTGPSGRLPAAEAQPSDVNQSLHRMVRIARTLVAPGVRIAERYGEPVAPHMAQEGLHQAVLHLILDAAQAVRGCGDVDVSARRADGMLVISVRDSRTSLSAARALLQPIFGSSSDLHDECASLGLLMARDFADEHGGSVTNRRCADGAHVVSIRLPLKQWTPA